MSRKYKSPLKNCQNCKRLCFCVRKEGTKEIKDFYCAVFFKFFLAKCDKKVIRVKKD